MTLNSQKLRHTVITCHHGSFWSDRIDPAPNLERDHRDLPAHEDLDHDRRIEPRIIRRPEQDFVAELLLDRRAIAQEDPVKKDLVALNTFTSTYVAEVSLIIGHGNG